MQRLVLLRRFIGITLSALLIWIPAQAALAAAAPVPESAESAESVQESDTAGVVQVQALANESPLPENGIISYYESPEGATSAFVRSNGETLVICFDTDVSGLAAMLEQEGADHIDSLIIAPFSDAADDTALRELHEMYPVGHLYVSSGHAALQSAGQLGIKTDYAEYLSVGNENVILYPDTAGNLGVLIFDASSSLFAADAMSDMSALQGHQEIAYISVLSISDKTGTDADIISLMDPQTCIITGSLPEEQTLSDFYNTEIARTQTFYMNHFSKDGIVLHFPRLNEVQNAAFLHMPVPDPQLFVVPEAETDAPDQTTEDQTAEDQTGDEESRDDASGQGSEEGQVSSKQAIAEAALRIWRGEIGQGQTRTDTLRSEGFSDDEMVEIQRLVDKIASEKLGACTAVVFNAGDYAEDPDAQIVTIGKTATDPQLSSTDESHQFTGWYTDKECTEKFDFSTPIQEETILYAGWTNGSEN